MLGSKARSPTTSLAVLWISEDTRLLKPRICMCDCARIQDCWHQNCRSSQEPLLVICSDVCQATAADGEFACKVAWAHDKLSWHWYDASELMFNSQWPLVYENSDGHTRALVQLGETVTKTDIIIIMWWVVVHARLGAAVLRRHLFTLLVHTM